MNIRIATAEPIKALEVPVRSLQGTNRILAIVGTLVVLKICDVVLGVRVRKEEEIAGLDVSLHGEEGYIFES